MINKLTEKIKKTHAPICVGLDPMLSYVPVSYTHLDVYKRQAMEPKCIILDEPTAMLDPNGRKEVLQAVKELNEKKGITVVLITHYMEEVTLADKVFVMDKGKIVMQGTPREVFSKVEELKSYRLDVPQVTLLAHCLLYTS